MTDQHPLTDEMCEELVPEGLRLDCDDIDVPPWYRGDDFYVYKEGYAAGWSDAALAADRARWGRATVEPPSKPAHNTAQDSSQRP